VTTSISLNFNLCLVIAIHISAVLFYPAGQRENLIHPMLADTSACRGTAASTGRALVSPWRALAVLVVVGVAVWLLVR